LEKEGGSSCFTNKMEKKGQKKKTAHASADRGREGKQIEEK